MFPTAIRAFSRSRVAFNASAPTGKKAAIQWTLYFIGISAGLVAGAGVLWQYNKDHSIKLLMNKKRFSDEQHKNLKFVQAPKPESSGGDDEDEDEDEEDEE